MSYIMMMIISLIIVGFVFFFSLLKRNKAQKQTIRESIKCEPEQIRPPKGLCGIGGCKIATQHFHAEDLRRRLKETKR